MWTSNGGFLGRPLIKLVRARLFGVRLFLSTTSHDARRGWDRAQNSLLKGLSSLIFEEKIKKWNEEKTEIIAVVGRPLGRAASSVTSGPLLQLPSSSSAGTCSIRAPNVHVYLGHSISMSTAFTILTDHSFLHDQLPDFFLSGQHPCILLIKRTTKRGKFNVELPKPLEIGPILVLLNFGQIFLLNDIFFLPSSCEAILVGVPITIKFQF
jgi:hypothetical protein